MGQRIGIDEKRILLLEGLSADIQRLEESMRDFRSETKETRATLTNIQLTLQSISSQELSVKYKELETKCFGDQDNSLDNRLRVQENWKARVIGMSAAGALLVSILVAWVSHAITKGL